MAHGSILEREIKLRFDSAADARAAVQATGATLVHGRRFQEDCLLDTEDEDLRRSGACSGCRTEERSLLTFKGPVLPGPMKIREELETVVADGEILHQVFERLGLHVWFRYQKYREEYSHQDVLIAVDETPVGTFVEIEGAEEGIMATAAAMGRTTADFILDSYHRLFLVYREVLGFRGH